MTRRGLTANPDLWAFPVDGGVSTQMTFGPGFKAWCVWSPDGKYIAYAPPRSPTENAIVARKPSDGSGSEETLLTMGPEIRSVDAVDWSRDGRYLSIDTRDKNYGTVRKLGVPLFGDRSHFARLRWMRTSSKGIFHRTATGWHIFHTKLASPKYLSFRFPGPGGKYQISHGGGWLIRWDNKSNFYFFSPGNQLIKAEMNFSGQSLAGEIFAAAFSDRPAGHGGATV